MHNFADENYIFFCRILFSSCPLSHGLKVFCLKALAVGARQVVVVDEEAAVRGVDGAGERQGVVAVAGGDASHGEQGVEHAVALCCLVTIGVECRCDGAVALAVGG